VVRCVWGFVVCAGYFPSPLPGLRRFYGPCDPRLASWATFRRRCRGWWGGMRGRTRKQKPDLRICDLRGGANREICVPRGMQAAKSAGPLGLAWFCDWRPAAYAAGYRKLAARWAGGEEGGLACLWGLWPKCSDRASGYVSLRTAGVAICGFRI
jgi:hypothetical protein